MVWFDPQLLKSDQNWRIQGKNYIFTLQKHKYYTFCQSGDLIQIDTPFVYIKQDKHFKHFAAGAIVSR